MLHKPEDGWLCNAQRIIQKERASNEEQNAPRFNIVLPQLSALPITIASAFGEHGWRDFSRTWQSVSLRIIALNVRAYLKADFFRNGRESPPMAIFSRET